MTDAEIATLKAEWTPPTSGTVFADAMRTKLLRLIAALEESRRERADMVMKCAAQIPGERATARALAFEEALRFHRAWGEFISVDFGAGLEHHDPERYAKGLHALASLPPALRAVPVVLLEEVRHCLSEANEAACARNCDEAQGHAIARAEELATAERERDAARAALKQCVEALCGPADGSHQHAGDCEVGERTPGPIDGETECCECGANYAGMRQVLAAIAAAGKVLP